MHATRSRRMVEGVEGCSLRPSPKLRCCAIVAVTNFFGAPDWLLRAENAARQAGGDGGGVGASRPVGRLPRAKKARRIR